jgi:hypothetical protein
MKLFKWLKTAKTLKYVKKVKNQYRIPIIFTFNSHSSIVRSMLGGRGILYISSSKTYGEVDLRHINLYGGL